MADIAPWEEYALGLPPTRKPEEEVESTSALGAFASHTAEGAVPALAGLGGWEAGAALGSAVFPGPGTIAGGIGGALLGSYAAHKAEEKIMPTPWSEYLKQSEKEHPTASFAGELTSQVAAFRPSVSTVGRMMAGGLAGGGIEAGAEKWRGEDLDPTRIAMSIASGSVLMKPSGLIEGFQKALAKPNNWMVESDIALNKLLGGENETISARVYKTQDTNPYSAAIAKVLNTISPGHTERSYLNSINNKIENETAPNVIKDAQQMVAKTMNEIRAGDRQSAAIVNKVNSLVPSIERRAVLTRAMEHPEEADAILSGSKEQEAYSVLRKAFDTIGQRAVEAEVIRGMKENYITHIVDWSKSNSKMADALDYFLNTNVKSIAGRTTSKFAKTRKYETIEELNTALKDRGLSLKTEDPAEILQLYSSSMEKAIAGKNLVSSLKKMKLSDGTNLLFDSRQGGFVPKGWEMSNSHFLQGYALHPELKPVLEHMFYSNNPGIVMQVATATSNLSKRLNVMGSLFHSASLVQALISSGFKIAGKELATGGKGIRSAVNEFRTGGIGGTADKWLKSGLVVEVPGDVDRQALSHVGAVVDTLAARSGIKLSTEKVLSVAEKATMQKIDKITWDYIHTGGKILTAEKYLEKAKLDHPEVPEEVLRKEISEYVNNSFGALNWTQIAADSSNKFTQYITSPNARQALNLIFFAPDWTASTLRAFTSMFGKGSGLKGLVKPRYVADFARRYQMRSALIYFTVLNGINMAVSGHPIWENKDKTRIEFPDGTSMQMSKHAMEPLHWLTDPEKTLANKLGFWPHAAITYWGEKQYPFGPELQDKSIGGKMERIAEQALPFQLQSAAQAPEGEGLKRFLLGTFGMPIYGMTGAQKAQARRERQIRRNELRRKLMENK